MKLPPIQKSSPKKIGVRPCDELFIYYLKGRLELRHQKFRNNFLGNWEEEDDSILFFSNPADRQIEDLLHRQPDLEYLDSYRMSYDHWLGEKFSAMELGPFRIVPPWEAADVQWDATADKRLIVLDPGLVFGTGTHPTTRDCLEAIELAAESMNISSVLDLGTGTGLLALAAARLGCEYIVGVDLNLLAARTAARNVRLNRLESRIVIAQGRAEDMIAYPTDLLIANIHYAVMHQLVNNRGFLAKKRFILSGLMRGDAKHIVNLLQRQPVKIIKQWTQDGIWHTIYGKSEQEGKT
ncbi:MAG: methyltransferase domain-containing protein [bacterium]|nr:methyltransferase domain-containing protein [bacterium]